MSQIKFRGWNKKSHVMVDNIRCFAPGSEFNLNDAFDPDMIVLPLQFANYQDANNVEIFEGDILSCEVEDDYPEEAGLRIVKRDIDGMFAVCDPGHSHGLPLRWGGYTSIKVVGNIYANPDMVDDTEED